MNSRIPRIIHQSWKTRELPPKWDALRQTWIARHPHWEYRFWTDDDNQRLIRTEYPELIPLYDSYPLSINRAELARYMVVRRYGGVYLDLDFECLRPLDDLIAGPELVFGLEPKTHSDRAPVRERGLSRLVCNAFIASVPDHRFWTHLVGWLERSRAEPSLGECTGFFLLTRACDSFPEPSAITLLPAGLMYPIDNRHGVLTSPERSEIARTAYAIHYWHGSWWREATLKAMHDRIGAGRGRSD